MCQRVFSKDGPAVQSGIFLGVVWRIGGQKSHPVSHRVLTQSVEINLIFWKTSRRKIHPERFGGSDTFLIKSIGIVKLRGNARGGSMARAMYFEFNRSSRDGMIAVGSVIMNRVKSDAFPDTICGVVSQKNQFAPGVMSKSMDSRKVVS